MIPRHTPMMTERSALVTIFSLAASLWLAIGGIVAAVAG